MRAGFFLGGFNLFFSAWCWGNVHFRKAINRIPGIFFAFFSLGSHQNKTVGVGIFGQRTPSDAGPSS